MPFFDVEERELRRFPVEEKRPFPGEAQDGPTAEKRPFPGNVKRRWPEPQVGEAEREEYRRAFYPGGMPPGMCVLLASVGQLSKGPFV